MADSAGWRPPIRPGGVRRFGRWRTRGRWAPVPEEPGRADGKLEVTRSEGIGHTCSTVAGATRWTARRGPSVGRSSVPGSTPTYSPSSGWPCPWCPPSSWARATSCGAWRLLFATGAPDLFDGPVAKASGTASVRGAFFDSVADRVSDAVPLRRCGVVPRRPARRSDGAAALRRAGRDLAHLLPAGQGRAARLVGQGRAHGAGRAVHPARPVLHRRLGVRRRLRAGAVGVLRPALGHRPRALRRGVEGSRGPGASPSAPARRPAADGAHRSIARWREGRVDSRWRAWREARARATDSEPRAVGAPAGAVALGRWRPGAPGTREPLGTDLAGPSGRAPAHHVAAGRRPASRGS